MDNQEERMNQHIDTADDLAKSDDSNSLKQSPLGAFSDKLLSSVYLEWLMIIFLPLLVLLKYQIDRVDGDLWWHMAHGKYYLTHHTLKMDLSVFSWTPTDPTWIYNTCLGSTAIYLIYNFMGGFGLWLMQWLVFGGIFLAFYLFLRLVNQRLDINSVTIIATIAIGCYTACRFYKPELFSALLFCWTVFIFFYVKIKRAKYLFYLYPLIFALWVNLHGAFVVGLTFLALAFIGETLNRLFFPRESLTTQELGHFGGACVLSAAATLLNPYGVHYPISLFPTIVSAIGFKSYSGEYGWLIDNFALSYESLWPYLKSVGLESLDNGLTAWILTIMMISVLGLLVYGLIRKRTCDFSTLIIGLALYWKGMETSRTSYFFPIAFFFVFFYLLIFRLKFKRIPVRAKVFSLLVFVLFFIGISWFTIRYGADNKWFGAGIDDYAPVKEVAFLKKSRLDGPVFNDYGIGGYLTWKLYPDYKVFIDPRGALYRNQVFPDYVKFTMKNVTTEDIQLLRKKYPFKIAIIHYRQLELIFDFLTAGDEWRLLYFEKNAAILVHKSLFPVIRWESVNANLSPVRFIKEKNPEILANVFNIYVFYNPLAGRYIYNIFKNNVSNCYGQKNELLTRMDMEIRQREKLQDKSGRMPQ
jgi:hypothetical protein